MKISNGVKKKFIILIVIVLILVAGGGFFWWQNQMDVRELNKNLPEGVRVVKSLFSKEYKVINKIDGYEVKVPKDWEKLTKVEYYEEEKGKEGITGLSLEGLNGKEKSVGIVRYKLSSDINLEDWVKEYLQKIKLTETIIERKNIGSFEVIQVKIEQLAGLTWYFFKQNLNIYQTGGISEKLLREIILNGKW